MSDAVKTLSDAVAKLWPAVIALTPDEQEELRLNLEMFTCAEPTDSEFEATWGEEINRRIAAVESGEDELIPAEEVFRRLDEKYGR